MFRVLRICPAWLAAATLVTNSHALNSTSGQHLEITPNYDTASSQWTWTAVGNQVYPLNEVFFSGKDATGSSGTRITRASDPKWDFMGVPAGATLWRFRDTIVGTPGFADTQASLSSSTLDYRLQSVQGPPGGLASLYFSNTNPIVHFRTDNGIDATDLFSKPANHTHLNWAFTQKGLWIVHLTVQGTLNSPVTPTPASAPQPLVFAIGDYAIWTATQLNMSQVQNSDISGDLADPDSDGFNNLMEYALGGSILTPSLLRTHDGQALAPQLLPPASPTSPWRFQYYRRTAASGSELNYQVESSPTLAHASWTTETGPETPISSDGTWQLMNLELANSSTSPPTQFYRLKISLIP